MAVYRTDVHVVVVVLERVVVVVLKVVVIVVVRVVLLVVEVVVVVVEVGSGMNWQYGTDGAWRGGKCPNVT